MKRLIVCAAVAGMFGLSSVDVNAMDQGDIDVVATQDAEMEKDLGGVRDTCLKIINIGRKLYNMREVIAKSAIFTRNEALFNKYEWNQYIDFTYWDFFLERAIAVSKKYSNRSTLIEELNFKESAISLVIECFGQYYYSEDDEEKRQRQHEWLFHSLSEEYDSL